MRFISLLAFGCIFPSIVVCQELLFKAASPDITIYIVGSNHLGLGFDLKPNKSLIEAITKSDYVLMEEYKSGETEQQIPNFFYTKERQNYKEIGDLKNCIATLFPKGDPHILERMQTIRPFFAALVLDKLRGQEGFKFHSLDALIVNISHSQKKEIISIEKAEDFLSVLNTLTFQEELKFLEVSARRCVDNEYRARLSILIREQQNCVIFGTLEKLIEQAKHMDVLLYGNDDISEKLVYARNASIFKKIMKIVQHQKTYLVVVGALHLPQSNGLLNSLSNSGFVVTKIREQINDDIEHN